MMLKSKQPSGSVSPQSRPRRAYPLWVNRVILSLSCLATLTACGQDDDRVFGIKTSSILHFGLPTGITDQAHEMRNFWTWTVIGSMFVGALVWGLTFYTIIRFRKKKTDPEFPPQVGYNVLLEATYTIVPIFIILTIFWKTVLVENFVTELKPNPGVVVDVTAFKWNWKFGYNSYHLNGHDYYGALPVDGINDVKTASGLDLEKAREAELLEKQPHGNEMSLLQLKLDEIETAGSTTEIPVLVLPVDTRIEFRVASADVIHSFFVPEFLFKRDVFPFPYAEHSEFRFQVNGIERTGYFVGRCAEMCGEYHSAMNFEVRALSKEKFLAYMSNRQKGQTSAQALQAIGEPPVAQATKPFFPSA